MSWPPVKLLPEEERGRNKYEFITNWFIPGGKGDYYPAGKVTDGGSIPRIFSPLYSPTDVWAFVPFLIHDFQYTLSGGTLAFDNDEDASRSLNSKPMTRRECDAMLLANLKKAALDSAHWYERTYRYSLAVITYPAVRLGGGKEWTKIEKGTHKWLTKSIKGN